MDVEFKRLLRFTVQALIKILALIILSLVTAVHWVCFNQMYISKLLVFCYVIIYAWMILGSSFSVFCKLEI